MHENKELKKGTMQDGKEINKIKIKRNSTIQQQGELLAYAK